MALLNQIHIEVMGTYASDCSVLLHGMISTMLFNQELRMTVEAYDDPEEDRCTRKLLDKIANAIYNKVVFDNHSLYKQYGIQVLGWKRDVR